MTREAVRLLKEFIEVMLRLGTDIFGFDIAKADEEPPKWLDPLALFDIWDQAVKLGPLRYYNGPNAMYPSIAPGIGGSISVQQGYPAILDIVSIKSPTFVLGTDPGMLYEERAVTLNLAALVEKTYSLTLVNGVAFSIDANCDPDEIARSIDAVDRWASMNGWVNDGDRTLLPGSVRTIIQPDMN